MIAGGVAVLFYILFGFLALPPILKSILSKSLSQTLHRNVTIREIRVNPLELSVSVRGLVISERGSPGTWVSAKEIFANLQLASVIRGGPVLSEVRLYRPYVKIVRRPDESYNFTDILDESRKKPADKGKPLKYSLNNIRILDGSIDFEDLPKKTRNEVRGIDIGIPFLSNLQYYVNRYVQPSFAAVVNGEPVALKGRTKPFSESLETTFDVNVSDLDIPHYLAYVPLKMEYEIPSALLDVHAVVSYSQQKDKTPILRVKGDVTLKEVRVTGKDKSPMIHLPTVKAVIFPSDLAARDFHLTALQVRDPEIDVSIDSNKRFNLSSLIPEDNKGSEIEKKKETTAVKEEPGGKEQKITVDSIRLTGGKVRFADASRGMPFRTELEDLRVDVDRLGTEAGKKAVARVSFSTEAGETADLKGDLSLSPLGSEGTVALAKVVLKKYAPYYGDAVRFDIDRGIPRRAIRLPICQGGGRYGVSSLRSGVVRFEPSPAAAGGEGGVPRHPRVRCERGGGRPRKERDRDRRGRHGEGNGVHPPFRHWEDERHPSSCGGNAIRGAARGGRPRGGTVPRERAGWAAVEDHHQENGRRPVLRKARGSHHGPAGGDRPRPAAAEGGEHRHRRKTSR